MSPNDLVQRIVDRVGRLTAAGPLELDTEVLAGALREALALAVHVDSAGRHFPGLDVARAGIQGRIRQPKAMASINRARDGGIRIRLDSDQDPAFWVELTLSNDLLNRLGYVNLAVE